MIGCAPFKTVVTPHGNVNRNNYDNHNGVRPFCITAVRVGSKPKSESDTKRRTTFPLRVNIKFMDKDIMTDFGNLYRAYKDAKSGKGHNGGTKRFAAVALDGIHQLRQQLIDQTYQISGYNEFKIYEPKERMIKSCQFKDKVVQHCLCDNILLPRLRGVFITDNYAGQIGKGTLFGLNRLRDHMLDHYEKYGNTGWILKCDIGKYFYSIDHDRLKDIVEYYFQDEYTMWLNNVFIDSTESPGLPLGNQVAQVYALLVLHQVDVLVTGELGITHYGRYMDDFFLIYPDKVYLKHCLEAIQSMVESLGLQLNSKTQLIPFHKGIRFSGFHHYVTDTGKYIRKLTGDNKRKNKRKYRRLCKAVNNGKMSRKKFDEKYTAWKNHASHGNCKKLCKSMDEMVEELLKENRRSE